MSKILVTGAGGFIGHHLVKRLKADGHWVRGVDIKPCEYERSPADEFGLLDMRVPADAAAAVAGVERVYALAADMGGMGFISKHHTKILHNNALINIHTIAAASEAGVKRYLYTSSACIYPEYRQTEVDAAPLKEADAYPAQPQDAYGWEKLFTEQLCHYYGEAGRMETRVVRFHNIFGPLGTWRGGREKVPAALCRKIARAKAQGVSEIEIWGDGEQTRSFCYISDCVEGLTRLMDSNYGKPLNLGQDRMISINQLADMIASIAGIQITKKHVAGPQGVRGRNSDNTKLKELFGWEPGISLEEGMRTTYDWVEAQVLANYREEL